jgi:hypothetical protein
MLLIKNLMLQVMSYKLQVNEADILLHSDIKYLGCIPGYWQGGVRLKHFASLCSQNVSLTGSWTHVLVDLCTGGLVDSSNFLDPVHQSLFLYYLQQFSR